MRRIISRSVILMFLFDMLAIASASYFSYRYFGLPQRFHIPTVVLTTVLGAIVLYLKSQYKIREFNVTKRNYYLLFEGVIFFNILPFALLFFFVPKMSLVCYYALTMLLTYVALELYRFLFHYYLFNFKKVKNVLIIGSDNNAKIIAEEIINKKALRMKVAGFFTDVEDENYQFVEDCGIPIYLNPYDLAKVIRKQRISVVIIAIKRRMEEQWLTHMVKSIPEGVKVYKMPEFYEMITGKYFVSKMSINWLFYDYMNKRSMLYDACKRIYDVIAATIILTVTFPILLYIGIRVKMTDGGPAIYTQTRVGKNGKKFKMYKLRTMYINDYKPRAGEISENTANVNDDRVIPFCKFVRKARFDEIPQMINILKGEMSIVGPRTEWEDLVKIYSEEISYYSCRMWVKTGWTGWAQINQGHCVMNDDISEKLQYDLYYLKHRNLFWEIGILVKAVFLALGGRHG